MLSSPSPARPAFVWAVRVYWEDTDAGGVVYHSNYLNFCERARTEWLRHLEMEQRSLAAREGALFAVSEATMRYLAPARLDDALEIDVALARVGSASLDFIHRVRRVQGTDGPGLLAEARVRVACIDATALRPRRLPQALLDRLG